MTLERYRIWKQNGTYEVAVAHNRYDALDIAIRENDVVRENVIAVGKATSRGRLFKVEGGCFK